MDSQAVEGVASLVDTEDADETNSKAFRNNHELSKLSSFEFSDSTFGVNDNEVARLGEHQQLGGLLEGGLHAHARHLLIHHLPDVHRCPPPPTGRRFLHRT